MEAEDKKANEKSGAQLIVEVLKSHGVKFICTLCGGSTAEFILEAHNAGIRIVDTRQEATGVFAAKASSHITGVPGVMTVTTGPGLANTIHGALDATFNEVPLLILSGGVPTKLRSIGYLQDMDQVGLMKTVCKAAFTLQKKSQVISIMKKAFQIALSDVPGPVYVEMPTDVLVKNFEFKPQPFLRGTDEHEDLTPKEVIDTDFAPFPVCFPKASAPEIAKSTSIITTGAKPVLVVGAQAVLQVPKIKKLSKRLKKLQIPTFLLFSSKGLMGKSHKYLLTQDTLLKKILPGADTVILAGVPCDWTIRFGLDLPKKGNIISVNRSGKLASLNDGTTWFSAQIVESDVCHYLIKLSKALRRQSYAAPDSWISSLRAEEDEYEAFLHKKTQEKANIHLNPLNILRTLESCLGHKDILWTFDTGDFTHLAPRFLKPSSPLSWIGSEPFAGVGCGIGYAIGAKLSCPGREVWTVAGDGSHGYAITEFDTLNRHNIPIGTFIGNDGRWNEVCRKQIETHGSAFSCTLDFSHYDEIVKVFDARGYRVDQKNENSLKDIVNELSHLVGQGTTSGLINVLMGLTDILAGYT